MNYSIRLLFTTILFFSFSRAILITGQEMPSLSGQDDIAWYIPINTENRQSLEYVQLTNIGSFGLLRKARTGIPAHLHTGVDLKRPSNNYIDELIFPAARGTVISLRDDGPYAQIIIEHSLDASTPAWTVYEHVSGIKIRLNESVDPHRPIARFMNRDELDKYGWQFDHVHFEVMRVKPKPLSPDKSKPSLYYETYCLVCYTQKDLDERYYHPLDFLKQKWDNIFSNRKQ